MDEKIKLSQMNVFLSKLLTKFSYNYQPLLFCKILRKFLEPIQSYEDVPFSGTQRPICSEKNFFGTNYYYYFHVAIGPLHCAKLKKILRADPVMRMHHFWAQNGPFSLNNFFFWKILNIIYLLAPFIVQNF